MLPHDDPARPAGRAARRRALGSAVRGGRIVVVEPYDAPVPEGRSSTWPSTRCCCPGSSTPTCTSTSRGAPSGRASPTATRAAAAGGVTTLIDMPLNSIPPTVDGRGARGQAGLRAREAWPSTSGSGAGRCPGTSRSCAGCTRPGVFGFKCFLLDSGVDEFPPLLPDDLEPVLAEIARLGVAARRARRGRRRRSTARPRPPATATPTSSPPARAARRTSRSPGCWSGRAGPGRARTSCTCPARTPCRCSRRPAATASL